MTLRQGQKREEDEKKRQRGDAESAEERRKAEKNCARAEKVGADYAGSGAAEPAGRAADAWVPGEPGAGAEGDPGLGGDFTAAGLLLAGKIGAGGDDSRFGIGRAGGGAGAQHL